MRSNVAFMLMITISMRLFLYLFARKHHNHYFDRPLRYGPLIPHLKSLFHEFCEIRNNQTLSRAEADTAIDQLIMEKGSTQLLWAYDTFKIEKEAREKRFWRRHAKRIKYFSDEAKQLDAKIQEVRSNTNLTYSEECRQVNELKLNAEEHVRIEMQLRIEDCKEFTRVRPQLAKNRCYTEWSIYPIYHGVPPEEIK